MKTLELPKEIASLLPVAEAADAQTLVFIEKKRPVAALVSLKNVDRESLALSTNPQFLRIIDRSRKEIRAGKTVSLESVERRYRPGALVKRPMRVAPKRGS